MLEALLFDLDGTLLDSDPLHFTTWRDALRPFGVEIDEEAYRRRISGRLNPDIVGDLLPDLERDEADRLIEAKEAAFREAATGLEPLPGASELIARARAAGLRLAVVTNAPRRNAAFMLDAIGLSGRFDTLVLAEEVEAGKPHPAPYLEALRRTGAAAGRAYAFEDSVSGARAAAAAGIAVAGITTTHPPEELEAAGAERTAPDYRDAALLARLAALGL